ncbi:uncharacterized protein LOC129000053 [Macrosteles quadrilineatus]|uniref:uncharacterized protein LOC129000053 n=1 Tax=Macrosteles quadrilineatus TaxID=74068 RepID=UPI0023E09C4D|nr:uncharacterized protein LOC129000053 [Macrosteles quadrilineatus]
MGDLPTARVTPARPFTTSGVDYCGPFDMKVVNLRGMRHIKTYICVFVCFVTKAVHLEVVEDLTTEGFIAALTRFISRRGFCKDIYSDCGTNFVGADSALRRTIKNTLSTKESEEHLLHFTSSRKINFHFNPPASPHQGGLWEAAVKSVKYHLRRVMALTPGHFLIGSPLASIPEEDHTDIPLTRLKRWHLVQALHQRIWKRWQLEYLHTLQQRSKWTHKTENIKVGDLVLIHSSSPPLSWPLARVTQLHPGTDGQVRVVDLKTQHGYLTRPGVKVFPLPQK